jgi:hypothetical protein
MAAALAKQKREALAGFGRENLKAGGAATCCFIW